VSVSVSSSKEVSPRLRRALAAMGKELVQGLVPLWIYNDEELYQAELERIFARTWIFMVHETEIPNKGDFVVRNIADDHFIVVRSDDNRIRVLFNGCRHRGASVCLSEKGSAKVFVCPYHGWTYKNTGVIDAIPNRKTAFKGIDENKWGLLPAPRVETYGGLVFASLDETVKPLTEHLGEYRWYLDLHLRLSPGGMEVIGEPHRWFLDADWKSGSENFSGDSYHTQSLHRSVVNMGLSSRAAAGASGGKNDIHVTECSGHATSIRRMDPGQAHYWGYPTELQKHFQMEGLTEAQRDLAARSVSHTGTIFPNLSLIHIGLTDIPGKPDSAYLSFRQWSPVASGKTEVRSWVLVPKEASAEYKARAYKVATATFSVSGNFEQDDSIAWAGVARSAGGQFAKKSGMLLNYQMGMEFMSDARVLKEWPGPGVAYDSNLEEGVQRTFFNHWYREMCREPALGNAA
jgi:phenylpropionate dioxygenase-like ring-hydroxylating dioxygenase large terminal subunit